jgi:glycosyltransferase involved in cell wall biosynthesis
MDTITLAMPVYNAAPYVERALLSALSQTYENIEYLIVNDKGTDNSMTIVRDVISTHPRGKQVRIIEHPVNLGVGAARNTAIEQAKGKYLFFMDSDDEIALNCIQKLHEEMEATNVDVVFGSHTEVRGSEFISFRQNARVERNKERIVLTYFDSKFAVGSVNKLYKISFLRMNNIKCLPSHTKMEDVYFSFQLLLNAQSYSVISDITYFVHRRSDSASGGGNWSEQIFSQWVLIFAAQIEFLQKLSLDPALNLKVKKNLFKVRWVVSKNAMRSPYNVRGYINDYLNTALLKDKDIFRSPFLCLAYIISAMPLPIKKIGLLIHLKLKKNK